MPAFVGYLCFKRVDFLRLTLTIDSVMGFLIVYLLTGISCSVLSGCALTVFADYAPWVNWLIYLLQLAAWFAPILIWRLQNSARMSPRTYGVLAQISYFLFGFVFLLFAVLILRDLLWYGAYFLAPRGMVPAPYDVAAARLANWLTLGFLMLLCAYGVYGAFKLPQVLRYTYRDARIKRPLKALVISDWHITRLISPQKEAEKVAFFNALKPDLILMPGDIADDTPEGLGEHLKALKKLQAPSGIYYTVGNHEIYHNAFVWEAAFAGLGWQVLHNSGAAVAESGVYVGGVPDSGGFSVNVAQAVKNAAANMYRIVLSHQPAAVLQVKPAEVDLLVAGHTHGGQIVPFNFLTKFGNAGFVAGEYKLQHTTLLLSRGAGYWGPPMRLGAPSDVLLLNLEPY